MRLTAVTLAIGLLVSGCTGERRAAGPATWRLVEDLRMGGADSGASSFSDIRGLAVTPAGGILVLDYQPQEIRLFDSAGRFVKVVARKGEGPGEITSANGMAAGPDGRLVVNDPQSRRFSIYDASGAFVEQHVVPGWGYGYLWNGGVDTAGRTYEAFYVRRDTLHIPSIRRFSPDFSSTDTLPMPPCMSDLKRESYLFQSKERNGVMGVPYTAEVVGYVDDRGSAWCARSDEDLVIQMNAESGDTVRTIRGTRAAAPITAAEHDSAVAGVEAFAKQLGATGWDLSRIGKLRPIILNLSTDDAGRLWVLTGAADSVSIYDVYDRDGAPLATVRANFTGSSVPGWHPVIRGDRFYTIVTDADGVPAVVRARLEHTP